MHRCTKLQNTKTKHKNYRSKQDKSKANIKHKFTKNASTNPQKSARTNSRESANTNSQKAQSQIHKKRKHEPTKKHTYTNSQTQTNKWHNTKAQQKQQQQQKPNRVVCVNTFSFGVTVLTPRLRFSKFWMTKLFKNILLASSLIQSYTLIGFCF